jgi:hypothetical protein
MISGRRPVEEVKQIMIPTRSKAKISHLLSFPIGAERISKAFAGTPRIAKLFLHFHFLVVRQFGDRIGIGDDQLEADKVRHFFDERETTGNGRKRTDG